MNEEDDDEIHRGTYDGRPTVGSDELLARLHRYHGDGSVRREPSKRELKDLTFLMLKELHCGEKT